jgi:hypothetical protein
VRSWWTGHSDIVYLLILQTKKKYNINIDDKASQMSHWQISTHKIKKREQLNCSLHFCIYKNTWQWYGSSKTTQLRVTIATKCLALTCYMSYTCNVSYVACQKRASGLLFPSVASIRWAPIIFWCGLEKCGISYKEDRRFTIDYLYVLAVRNGVRRRCRRIVR